MCICARLTRQTPFTLRKHAERAQIKLRTSPAPFRQPPLFFLLNFQDGLQLFEDFRLLRGAVASTTRRLASRSFSCSLSSSAARIHIFLRSAPPSSLKSAQPRPSPPTASSGRSLSSSTSPPHCPPTPSLTHIPLLEVDSPFRELTLVIQALIGHGILRAPPAYAPWTMPPYDLREDQGGPRNVRGRCPASRNPPNCSPALGTPQTCHTKRTPFSSPQTSPGPLSIRSAQGRGTTVPDAPPSAASAPRWVTDPVLVLIGILHDLIPPIRLAGRPSLLS